LNIGLTQRIFYHKGRAYDSIEHGWYRYLKDHTLFFIPNDPDQDFNQIAKNIDALIITGGDDSALRRVVELRIASAIMKLQKPILGVCHGAFMLTDILGGSLKEDQSHMDVDHNIWYHYKQIQVNSYHTNIINMPHSDAKIIATDNDGNTEAWLDGNISAVVWHPERMDSPWLPQEIQDCFFNK
jgi:gamma-glutamyl-gamma-aminobutyrate hydrolase PuuD